jgi:TonB family protein
LDLPDPDPPQQEKLELPPPKRTTSARVAPNPQPPMRTARYPGPEASRDEYLAYCAALIARNFGMLPSSFIAGRQGRTILVMSVLDDGTIARVSIVHSSGYPDIDGRIEQMVAAVRRLPPVPQWFQGSHMPLEYELHFPIPGR